MERNDGIVVVKTPILSLPSSEKSLMKMCKSLEFNLRGREGNLRQ